MSERNGATQFLLDSQKEYSSDIETYGPPPSRLISTAGMQAGDIVLNDVRALHRGILHNAPSEGLGHLGARPVLQLMFGVPDWVDDAPNWGTKPLVATPRENPHTASLKKKRNKKGGEVSLQD